MMNPNLLTKEIQDLYVRKNFQNLIKYFADNNQIVDFKFFEQTYAKAQDGIKIAHGLSYIPQDVIMTKITGPGVATFNRGLFDTTNINLSVSDACKIRFFVGSYFGSNASQVDKDATQAFSADVSSSSSSDSSGAGATVTTTSNYTVKITDQYIIADSSNSNGSFTITLPPANTYELGDLTIKRTAGLYANYVNIVPTGGGYIEGNPNRKLLTTNEDVVLIPSGSNWVVKSANTITPVVSYNPTLDGQGFGTVSAKTAFWYRRGDMLYSFGRFTGGIVAASVFAVPLPVGPVIDTTKIGANLVGAAGQYVGDWRSQAANGVGSIITATSTTTAAVYFGGQYVGAVTLTAQNGNIMTNSNLVTSYSFAVPITDWSV